MIPKIIHYCWFGRNTKTDLVRKCINSWKKYCPDYEIREWNEDIFDINSNRYVNEAYENKKWAFVSDYVRLYALYCEGGIYLDTDVEITQNIDEFLIHAAFACQEDEYHISTALIGAEKENLWIKCLLNDYKNRTFILQNGTLDLTTNVEKITTITKEMFKVEFSNNHIVIGNDIHIYPKEYFCILDIKRKDKNYCIHHFDGSWIDPSVIKQELLTYKNNYMTLNYIINDMYNGNLKLTEFLSVETFSIYGFGTIGKLLLKQCEEIDIIPKYIIDKDSEMINQNKICKFLTDDMKSDILIITPVMYFKNIFREINTNNFKKIVNINEIYNKENLLY